MEYDFRKIEQEWQDFWEKNQTNKTTERNDKPKYYGLTMFPYPSGAGLHVGHPLGYIASDIVARFKKHKGFNVLHPMGFDSFGLPAEQYAIQTGQHPALTTEQNINRYREQLDKLGFSFDWNREVRTSDPKYYRWTQWIFKQLFNAWFDKNQNKARKIEDLIAIFESEGNANIQAASSDTPVFNADTWKNYSEKEQEDILMNYRLTYLADSWVNWCPALGTVLANDEVVNGVSERGGHPVEQKLMRQWSMRITAYAERLLKDLDELEWSDAIKEQQRNWIGKSTGAKVVFDTNSGHQIEVFTTRPDTIFGVSFLVLAPEHDLVDAITTDEYKTEVEAYRKKAAQKSERDRQSEVKNITGVFTGAYAIHPFTKEKVAIWVGDYVLVGYGTGAVMAVPSGDQRDWDFAKHFKIDILNVFENKDISEGAYAEKDAVITNSDFLNGLPVKEAIAKAIEELEKIGAGQGKTNYRLRDAVFSRQRYWGEPFPVYYEHGIAKLIEDEFLPIELPEVDKYLPTSDGKPPLGNAEVWSWCRNKKIIKPNEKQNGECTWPMELNTMPGWAGSSWYFLRYMDPNNEKEFVSREKADYWGQVDLYIGGSEHATGHLLYSRFWTQFLYDMGYIGFREPFRKMINQGMILGNSAFFPVTEIEINYTFFHLEQQREVLSRARFNLFLSKNDLNYKNDGEISANTSRIQEEKIIDFFLKNFKDIIVSSTVDLSQDSSDYYFNRDLIKVKFLHQNIVNKRIPIDCLDSRGRIIIDKILNNSFYYSSIFTSDDINLYTCSREIEKMSKSKFNVQTPDELVEQYGADTLRCYEMFLGPVEQSKPWDTQGINGVHNFLRKFWRLFHEDAKWAVNDNEPDKKALKTLHKTIKKVNDDIERFSLNTVVSAMMICVNELTEYKTKEKAILEPLVVLLHPFAPHICEELWKNLGHAPGSLSEVPYPVHDEKHLADDEVTYPVSFNGKMRFKVTLPAGLDKDAVEKEALSQPEAQKWLEGKAPKKVIVVPGKIVNVVV